MERRPSSTALRVVLWGTVSLVVAAVALVALVPGPDLPGAYGDFAAVHDSLVRGSFPAEKDGLLRRAEVVVDGASVQTALHRHRGALITVHRPPEAPPRPRGAGAVAGTAAGSFAFEREDLLILVTPTAGGVAVLAGYTDVSRMKTLLEVVLGDPAGG